MTANEIPGFMQLRRRILSAWLPDLRESEIFAILNEIEGSRDFGPSGRALLAALCFMALGRIQEATDELGLAASDPTFPFLPDAQSYLAQLRGEEARRYDWESNPGLRASILKTFEFVGPLLGMIETSERIFAGDLCFSYCEAYAESASFFRKVGLVIPNSDLIYVVLTASRIAKRKKRGWSRSMQESVDYVLGFPDLDDETRRSLQQS